MEFLKLHEIDPSGAADGDVLSYDAATDRVKYKPATSSAVLYDAKGDVLIGQANDTPARLAVGIDGQVLVADSTAPLGVRWANPAAGGSGSLTVQDENGAVATGVTQIDFLGAGVTAGAGSGEVLVTIPGGGSSGSGGSTVKDRRWTPAPTSTSLDEFNDDTLDPAWTRVDGSGAPALIASMYNAGTEGADKVFDGTVATKWLVSATTGWLQFGTTSVGAVASYKVASANDSPSRDPKSWTLYGSNDSGATWTVIDSRTNQSWAARQVFNTYTVASPAAYSLYKFDVTQNSGDTLMQFSELQLFNASGAQFTVVVAGNTAPLANVTWAEAADVLSVYNAGGNPAAVIQAMVRSLASPLAVGDGFVTCLTIFGLNATANTLGGVAGLVLTDDMVFGQGQQVVALSTVDASNAKQLNDCRSMAGWNTNPASSAALYVNAGARTFIRLARVAANAWRTDVSPDGVTWIKGTATLSKTLTPTHVGLLTSSWGASTKAVTSYEFLRRVSGVS